MFAKRIVPITMLCISLSLAAEASPGGYAVRLQRMADGDEAPVARAATAAATPVAPPPDTAHFLVPFVLPADFTFPIDINDSGVIVGNVQGDDLDSSFIFHDGVETVFDPPRVAGFSELLAVNNRGDAVGDYIDAAGIDRAFLRTADGTVVDLPDPVPDFTFNIPSGINARGTIVGAFTTGPDFRSCTGYILRGGQYQRIDIPGATCVSANGINDHGDIVGNWLDATGLNHGFLIRGNDDDDARGPIVDISIDGFSTVPFHINNHRVIVGDYFLRGIHPPPIHGFVRREGEIRTLDIRGALQTFLTGMNDGGVIAGFSLGIGARGILAIPTSAGSPRDE